MKVTELESQTVIHELQLGEQLNECIREKRRSDFALMLAMLTSDVHSHSQFYLPQSESKTKTQDNAQLRKQFNLPKEPALSLTAMSEIQEFNQAGLVENNLLSSLKLADAMAPKPIAFRNDKKHLPTNVVDNTSIHCQKALAMKSANKEQERLAFNANGWLNTLQTSIVKAQILSA